MTEVRGVPLVEIRRRFVHGAGRITTRLLRDLRDDPRAGARSIAEELEARRRRASAERRRQRRLFGMERGLGKLGVERIAGVDEVGMGPLAGPVVAAAVVLPAGARLDGLRDSKLLTPSARERLDREIRACARALGIGWVGPQEVDRVNVYQAGLLAMRRAIELLLEPPEIALVDGRRIPGLALEQRAVIGGDRTVGSIAAASVVAKVWRDRHMRELDLAYPGYGFAHNAGYGTAEHLRALSGRGPSPAHRRSFAPVREARNGRSGAEG
ncbi:MAG: ribonuclease HII [Myxococcota bacterium]